MSFEEREALLDYSPMKSPVRVGANQIQYSNLKSETYSSLQSIYTDYYKDNTTIYTNENFTRQQTTYSTTSSFNGSTEKEDLYRAAILLKDAMEFRSIHHRLSTPALKLYKWYHSHFYQVLYGVVVFINLALAFFETPSSLSMTSDYRYKESSKLNLPCGTTEAIELLTIMFFLVDYIIIFYLLEWRRAVVKMWMNMYLFTVIFSIVDITVSLSLQCKFYVICYRKLLRPIFLFHHSPFMKKSIKAITRTIPGMLAIFFLLSLHIYIFAVLGMLLFPVNFHYNNSNATSEVHSQKHNATHSEEGDKYFATLLDSVRNLIFLLSTANNPNFMIPAYKSNRLYALYFIIFYLIGGFLLLNIFTALVYNTFRYYMQDSLQTANFMRLLGIRASFSILSRIDEDEELGIVNKVSLDTINRLLPQITFTDRNSLFTLKQTLQRIKLEQQYYLSWPEFKEHFFKLFNPILQVTRDRGFNFHTNGCLRVLQWSVHSRFGFCVQNGVSILNTIFISVELELSDASSTKRLSIITSLFTLYYVLEIFFKLAVLQKQFFRWKSNIFDLIITSIIVILQVAILIYIGEPFQQPDNSIQTALILIKVLCMVMVIRILRLLAGLDTLNFILEIIFRVIKNFKSFGGIMIALYYTFAFLGMIIFYDVDVRLRDNTAHSNKCGSFQELEFFANNFKDFYASLIVLWDLMIVNNWNVFVEAYRSVYTEWATIYFMAWYIVSVIIGINLLIAIILDAFITGWDEKRSDKPQSKQFQYKSALNEQPQRPTPSIRGMFQDSLIEPTDQVLQYELDKHAYFSNQ